MEKQSAGDRVREALQRKILSGELAPGARLREMEIARSLHTSQAPVREALRELEARELVYTESYKGTYVRETTQRDMLEAYLVRASLEQLAGQYAAEQLAGSSEPLRAIAANIEASAVAHDREAYARLDHEFHRTIVERAGNRILLRSWDALSFESRIEILLRTHTVDLSVSLAEHANILVALERGDGREAGRLLSEHSLRFAALLQTHAPSTQPSE
jgi:DNA-binding GntR family transcriptional regulator